MYGFDRLNKTSGIYWLKQPIEDLSIKITLKPQSGVINLPKYEDFTNTSKEIDLSIIETDKFTEHTFKWQEKVFSKWEIDYNNDLKNSISEDDVENRTEAVEDKPQKIFTYINEDYRLPLPIGRSKHYLNLERRIGGMFTVSNSMRHLFSNDDDVMEDEKWIAMHIVFDDSVYSDDSQLIVKQENILLSLFYNSKDNYLMISPDINDIELNPYNVDLESGSSTFQYAVNINFGDLDCDEEFVELMNKLYLKWERKHNQLVQFELPPAGAKRVYVTFEILTARGFDLDNIYIEYEIKTPKNTKCDDPLRGRTHVSKGREVDDDTMEWSYGHTVELTLDMAEGIETEKLRMFFEAISVDWWGRHRTEGYSYLPLTLTPGHFNEELSCSRPEERNKVQADSRRMFVGGCHLIKDLDVLSRPQSQNASFSYTATGSILVRWNTIAQSHAPESVPTSAVGSSTSALLQGAEAVLRQYSQARARLAAATKDLVDQD